VSNIDQSSLVISGVTLFDFETRFRLRKIFFSDSDSNSDSEKFCLSDSDSAFDKNFFSTPTPKNFVFATPTPTPSESELGFGVRCSSLILTLFFLRYAGNKTVNDLWADRPRQIFVVECTTLFYLVCILLKTLH
jgi:hypothetical protein